MKRSFTSNVAPRSGESSIVSRSSANNGTNGDKKRKKRRRPPRNASMMTTIIRALLLIVAVLCILDAILWSKRNMNTLVMKHSTYQRHADDTTTSRGRVTRPAAGADSDDTTATTTSISNIDHDKEQIYHILAQANVHKEDLDEQTRKKLPTWTQIQTLFGDSPKIFGLEESCERFRTSVESSVKFYGIAGTFNSGTNLLAALLIQNCQITERMKVYGERQKGMRWQVPWGKHTPAHLRESHVTETDKDVPLENSFPMIAIRDPFVWMQSMCRHPYEAFWDHNEKYCPNLMSPHYDGGLTPVYVNYRHTQTSHKSLIHMWNEWYREYMEVPYPRIIVRFEDLLFYGQNVTETLCKCGGGVPRQKKFKHISNSAKMGTAQHGKDKIGLVDAMIRYGTHKHRLDGLSTKELMKANELLDKELMEIFDYHYADIPEETETE